MSATQAAINELHRWISLSCSYSAAVTDCCTLLPASPGRQLPRVQLLQQGLDNSSPFLLRIGFAFPPTNVAALQQADVLPAAALSAQLPSVVPVLVHPGHSLSCSDIPLPAPRSGSDYDDDSTACRKETNVPTLFEVRLYLHASCHRHTLSCD